MKYLVALIVLIIAFRVNCADKRDHKIVFSSQSDQSMNDAIKQARSTLDDFWQIGSFTVCALFKTMDEKIVEQYKRQHGFVCEP